MLCTQLCGRIDYTRSTRCKNDLRIIYTRESVCMYYIYTYTCIMCVCMISKRYYTYVFSVKNVSSWFARDCVINAYHKYRTTTERFLTQNVMWRIVEMWVWDSEDFSRNRWNSSVNTFENARSNVIWTDLNPKVSLSFNFRRISRNNIEMHYTSL